MSRLRRGSLKALVSCALCVLAVVPIAVVAGAEPVSFVKEIAPILREKCLTCHGPEKAKGEYRLDTFELLQRPGGSDNPPIVAGSPEKSHLFELLTTDDDDDRMPQKDEALPKGQIALIERWIREGARFDAPDAKLSLASLAGYVAQPAPPESYRSSLPVTALAFDPSGQKLAVSGYHEVMIWNAADGTLARRITNVAERTLGLAYNHDGTLLATASGTPGRLGEAKLFDPKTGRLERTLAATPDLMLAVAFDAQGRRVACAGADHTIRIFNADSGQVELSIEQHADWVTCVAFSADGSNVVSSSRDKTVRVFDASTGELETTYTGHVDAVFSAAFAAGGKLIFSAGRDGKLHAWEARDAKKVFDAPVEGDVSRLLLSSEGVFLAAGKTVHQYSGRQKPEHLRTFPGREDVIYSLALHEGSGLLAAGSYDGAVRIWSVEDGKPRGQFKAVPMQLTSK